MLEQAAGVWDGEGFSEILDNQCWRKECGSVLGCHMGSVKSFAPVSQ